MNPIGASISTQYDDGNRYSQGQSISPRLALAPGHDTHGQPLSLPTSAPRSLSAVQSTQYSNIPPPPPPPPAFQTQQLSRLSLSIPPAPVSLAAGGMGRAFNHQPVTQQFGANLDSSPLYPQPESISYPSVHSSPSSTGSSVTPSNFMISPATMNYPAPTSGISQPAALGAIFDKLKTRSLTQPMAPPPPPSFVNSSGGLSVSVGNSGAVGGAHVRSLSVESVPPPSTAPSGQYYYAGNDPRIPQPPNGMPFQSMPPPPAAPISTLNGGTASGNRTPSKLNFDPTMPFMSSSRSGTSSPAYYGVVRGSSGTKTPDGLSRKTPPTSRSGSGSSSAGNKLSSHHMRGKSSRRIDPSLMPRPARLQSDIVYHTRAGAARCVPPIANAGFVAIDTGNCSPRFMRVTTCAPAANGKLAKKIGLPFAVVMTPFADVENEETPVQVASFGEYPPPRCSACVSYINCNVHWLDNGNKWRCNVCEKLNVTPPWYYCSLDGSGRRLDLRDRPELQFGSIEFEAPPEAVPEPLQAPVFLFAVDCSVQALANGAFKAACLSIRSVLSSLPGVSAGARAGIFSFGAGIQFYRLKSTGSRSSTDPTHSSELITMLVVDADDPFPVLPENEWLFSVKDQLLILDDILDRLPSLLQPFDMSSADSSSNLSSPVRPGREENRKQLPKSGSMASVSKSGGNPESIDISLCCPLAAMDVAAQALQALGIKSGRLILMTTNHVTSGIGKMRRREALGVYCTPVELSLYGALDIAREMTSAANEKVILEEYARVANLCVQAKLMVNTMVFTSESDFVDVALLSEACDKTGGACTIFHGSLNKKDHVLRLRNELQGLVLSLTPFDMTAKMRTSPGLQLSSYVGGGIFQPLEEIIEMVGVTSSTSFCIFLETAGSFVDDERVYLQLAAIYTTPERRRRIRVHNLCLLATNSETIMFKNVDMDAVTAAFTMQCTNQSLSHPIPKPRESLYELALKILLSYRTNCSAHSPKNHLVLPESLRLLPMYLFCLFKHPAMLDNSNPATGAAVSATSPTVLAVRAHERAFHLRRLRTSPVRTIIDSLYPRLFVLHVMLDDHEFEDLTEVRIESYRTPADAAHLVFRLPRHQFVSYDILESDGVYILDDTVTMWLFIGRNVPQSNISEWFNLLPSERPKHISFSPKSQNATILKTAVDIIRATSERKQELLVVWEDTPDSDTFREFAYRMVEDSYRGEEDCTDFLYKMHSTISKKL